MRRTLSAVAATLTVGALAVACGQTSGQQPFGQPTSITAVTSLPEETSSEVVPEETTPEESETSERDMTFAFGQTVTYDDGISVTISKPAAFKPSEYAAGTEGFSKFVIFTITILNKSGKTFDPGLTSESVMSGDVEGSEIFDSEHNLGGSPSTKILNGRKVTYKVAFGVRNPADLVMEFAPSWEHDSAMFTSTGK